MTLIGVEPASVRQYGAEAQARFDQIRARAAAAVRRRRQRELLRPQRRRLQDPHRPDRLGVREQPRTRTSAAVAEAIRVSTIEHRRRRSAAQPLSIR